MPTVPMAVKVVRTQAILRLATQVGLIAVLLFFPVLLDNWRFLVCDLLDNLKYYVGYLILQKHEERCRHFGSQS
ncbi:hypothetical protein EV127DRAFT_419866 [Xylaria flabelliformis]|nr:hypothetical protein EV127DRAFT_419866 [Xylaria flabelliformis]